MNNIDSPSICRWTLARCFAPTPRSVAKDHYPLMARCITMRRLSHYPLLARCMAVRRLHRHPLLTSLYHSAPVDFTAIRSLSRRGLHRYPPVACCLAVPTASVRWLHGGRLARPSTSAGLICRFCCPRTFALSQLLANSNGTFYPFLPLDDSRVSGP
jgi:hypothetical protein